MEFGWYWYLVWLLVFPGFAFTAVIGLLSTWVDRKVTARVQWRVGPPVLQPFYDFLKLMGKEIIIPRDSRPIVFLTAPLIGLAGVTVVSAILWIANIWEYSFLGDLIVVIYLLILPSLAVIIGGSASGNPYSAVGASREMKLILSYELPFLFCIATVIVKTGGSIRIAEIASFATIGSISGFIAFLISLLCIQAKLAFQPFDIPEAETEIMGGPFVEYSGTPLAVFKLTQAMMLFTLPIFLITIFLGGFYPYSWGILWGILKYILILTLIIVIKNTNPRLRIDQAINFFWKYCTLLGVIALVLAIIGIVYKITWL